MMHTLNAFANVENGAVAIERINEFVNLPPEEKDPQPFDVENKTERSWPSAGTLEFLNYSMRYR